MSTIKINAFGRVYAENMTETLFDRGGTAYGEFVKTKNGAYFFNGQGVLEVFLVVNGKDDPFFVSCSACDQGIHHFFSMSNQMGEMFGNNHSSTIEAKELIWEGMRYAKERGSAYAVRKAKSGEHKKRCIQLGLPLDSKHTLHELDLLLIEQHNAIYRASRQSVSL